MKLMIMPSNNGFTVYDADKMNRLDMFPNTKDGRKLLIEFLSKFVRSRKPKVKLVRGKRG